MPGVSFSPDAENDLIGIVDYIARDKPDAARRWAKRIRESCEMLAAQPDVGEARSGFGVPGCRSFTVGAYVIFFRHIPGGIEVARVVHGSRDMSDL